MGKNTNIAWCDSTWNPWEGCAKVSPGCKLCYAETRNRRFGGDNWGKGKPRRRTSAANRRLPIKWNAAADATANLAMATDGPCGEEPRRQRVFCASLADWLDDEVPIAWLADLLELIRDTPNLDWLMLSKRPENWAPRLKQVQFGIENADGNWIDCWLSGSSPSNVWIGASVEDQQRDDERIPELLKIPARVRFLSVEPMLGPINLTFTKPMPLHDPEYGNQHEYHEVKAIHWCIFGGESGPGARPCNVEWIRDGLRQCQAQDVAPFVKQLGADPRHDYDGQVVGVSGPLVTLNERVRIKNGPLKLHDNKGGDPAEWPEDLRVREFPKL